MLPHAMRPQLLRTASGRSRVSRP